MVNVKRTRINAMKPGGQKVATETVQNYVEQISAAWQSAVESIIKTGRLLIEAKATLRHGQFSDLINTKLPFGDRTAQMLMQIARHPVLANPKFVSHLPPSWGTLYSLSQLPEDVLEDGLTRGTINSGTQRDEIKNLNFYLFAAVPKALRVLIDFRRKWPRPEPLVDEMVNRADGNLSDGELHEITELPAWILELHDACKSKRKEIYGEGKTKDQ